MSLRYPRPLLCLGTGLFLGIGFHMAAATGTPADTPARTPTGLTTGTTASTTTAPNPNVVVLRSTRRVSLHTPKMRWTDLAKELSRQTRYPFSLDSEYEKDETACAYLLKDVPLSRVLGLTAYLSGGVWERKGAGYHLRPKTAEETAMDVDRYEALLTMARDYVARIPRERLHGQQQMAFDALNQYLPMYNSLLWQPESQMADLQVSLTERGISISQIREERVGNSVTGSSFSIGGQW